MPDDSPKDQPMGGSAIQDQPAPEIPEAASQPVQEVSASVASPDRAELLVRARSFLTSQARIQDSDAKRAFLAEKGLTSSEVDQLLRGLPPSVPPRTYPAPPPSNLPNLLAGVARIFTWLTEMLVVDTQRKPFQRYLLPRLAQSYQARLALGKYQSVLITRLTESASALKATQTKSYKDLPRTAPVYEESQYAQCHSIDDLLSHGGSSQGESSQPGENVPDITILRCALEELRRSKTDGISTEELFRYLESKLLWLSREEGTTRQSDLWNQLNSCLLFVPSVPKPGALSPLPLDHSSRLLWEYVPPPLPPTPQLLASLAKLREALPRGQESAAASFGGSPLAPTTSARQRTLQVLSDFTGYITTQTYTLGLPLIRGTNGVLSDRNPVEEELRREIRALKGLVLSRRSFLPFSAGVSGLSSDPPRFSEA